MPSATLLGAVSLTFSSTDPPPDIPITVPSGTQGVVVFVRATYSGFSISSSFTGAFQDVTYEGPSPWQRLQYANVTGGTGSQTITPDLGATIFDGPNFIVAFIGDIDNSSFDWVRDARTGQLSTLTVDSDTTDLVLAMQSWYTEFVDPAYPPPAPAGWTLELDQEPYGFTASALSVCDSPGATETSFDAEVAPSGEGGEYSGIGLIAIIGTSSGGAEEDLVAQEATHGHTADNLALSIAPSLLISEALHGHIADGLDLTLDAWLAVQDAWHEHRADNLTLSDDSIYTRAPAGGGYRRAQTVTARPARVAASGRLNRTSNTTRPRR